jgi:hypothetical protein
MKIFLPLTLIICCIFTTHFSYGQNVPEKKITMKLDSARFDQFVKQVEGQTGYYFYYDATRFDSLTLDLNVNNLSLRRCSTRFLKAPNSNTPSTGRGGSSLRRGRRSSLS